MDVPTTILHSGRDQLIVLVTSPLDISPVHAAIVATRFDGDSYRGIRQASGWEHRGQRYMSCWGAAAIEGLAY